MNKTAIILGASGLTGSHVLQILLNDDRYSTVKVFVRNPLEQKHQKLVEIKCDLLKLEDQREAFQADEVYVCIGSTNNKTPNKKLYRDIDFGIPVAAAKLCHLNNIKTIAVMSSLGADAKSTVFYPKTKGEMELAILDYNIENTFLVRPSLIFGPRKEKRLGENLGKILAKIISPIMIGPLKRYKGIHTQTIATAMVKLCNNEVNLSGIIESEKLLQIGNN